VRSSAVGALQSYISHLSLSAPAATTVASVLSSATRVAILMPRGSFSGPADRATIRMDARSGAFIRESNRAYVCCPGVSPWACRSESPKICSVLRSSNAFSLPQWSGLTPLA